MSKSAKRSHIRLHEFGNFFYLTPISQIASAQFFPRSQPRTVQSLGEEEGAPLGRLEVLPDEGAGVGAVADVPLVEDALPVALLVALARAGADQGKLAVLGKEKMFF